MKHLKVFLPLVALALVFASCSPKLPQADVDAANASFAAAQAAKADLYAVESFKAAAAANEALAANLTAKDYGKTKTLAKALLDASGKATTEAATGLEAAKTESAALATAVEALIPAVKKELAEAVKAGKKAKVDVKTINAGLVASPKALGAAKAQAEVAAQVQALTALKASLEGFKTTLEAAGFKG